MSPTVTSLLELDDFHLTSVAGPAGAALRREISWAHSSDLTDPTPWLEAGQLLLTDGLQFVGSPPDSAYDDYVTRLVDRGIVALGFATDIAHEEIPAGLVDACDRHGLPLLEVGERTPFMAIIRHVADDISAGKHRRLQWLSEAQRAVALAALRPDGLNLIVEELRTQLQTWVQLYDATGERWDTGTRREVPPDVAAQVMDSVRRMLSGLSPSSARVQTAKGGATLQTLGQVGRPLGVLAVGASNPLDAAERELVISVISLASIALEQSRTLETARLRVRAGMLEMLLGGIVTVADETAARLWGPLPSAPLRVVESPPGSYPQTLLADLELRAERTAGEIFYAERDLHLVIVVPEARLSALETLLRDSRTSAGVSGRVDWPSLGQGMTEASKAAARSSPARAITHFDSLADESVLDLLDATAVAHVAARQLAAVLKSPNPDHRVLLHTAEVWIEHNGAWEPAARALSIHRHTLRNRLSALERLLAIDLSRFADRAALWTALRHVEYPGKTLGN